MVMNCIPSAVVGIWFNWVLIGSRCSQPMTHATWVMMLC